MNFVTEQKIFPVEVVYSTRRSKSIAIQLIEGRIIVRCPVRVSEPQILRTLEEKRDWIMKTWERENQRIGGLEHWCKRVKFLGSPVKVTYGSGDVSQPNVKMKHGLLHVLGQATLPDDEWVKNQVEAWLKSRAKIEIRDRVSHWSRIMGCTYGQIRIKDLKSRWGSCSRLRNLNFNWRLVCAPTEVIDYVVVHELSHLFEMNHSPRFWRKVEQTLPEYKVAKNWLRLNGAELFF